MHIVDKVAQQADLLKGIQMSDALRAASNWQLPDHVLKNAVRVIGIDPASLSGDLTSLLMIPPTWTPAQDKQWQSRLNRKAPQLMLYNYPDRQRAFEAKLNFWEAAEAGYQERLGMNHGDYLQPSPDLVGSRGDLYKAWLWGPNFEFTGIGRIKYFDDAEELRSLRSVFRHYTGKSVEAIVEEGFEVPFRDIEMNLHVHPIPSYKSYPEDAEFYIRFRTYRDLDRWIKLHERDRALVNDQRAKGRPF